jgi:hypothetical protein
VAGALRGPWTMGEEAVRVLSTDEELMAKLRALTNLQVVADPAAATGYKLEIGPFPGWKDVPTW